MVAEVLRAGNTLPETVTVVAFSARPGEPERRLGVANASFGAGETAASAVFDGSVCAIIVSGRGEARRTIRRKSGDGAATYARASAGRPR